jgi:hypothetical protein
MQCTAGLCKVLRQTSCAVARVIHTGRVETFVIGTHGRDVHRECVEELERYGYMIECSEAETKDQPDGIASSIAASASIASAVPISRSLLPAR